MNTHQWRAWLLAAGCLVPLGSARASVPIPRTLSELTADAEIIFVGRCESVWTRWNDDHSLILTAHRFRVNRVLKGPSMTSITIEELGGMVGSVGMSVAGSPRYHVGEAALLFVYRTPLGRWATRGSGQGHFRVTRDAQGRPWVESDAYGADLAAMAPRGRPIDGAPLATFAARVQATAAAAPRNLGRP